MIIQVNYGDVEKTDAIDQYVHERVNKELAHFSNRITRVEVHLRDDNGSGKSGLKDKRCTMEARPAGHQPMAVEHAADSLHNAITDAAGKLSRVLRTTFDKAK